MADRPSTKPKLSCDISDRWKQYQDFIPKNDQSSLDAATTHPETSTNSFAFDRYQNPTVPICWETEPQFNVGAAQVFTDSPITKLRSTIAPGGVGIKEVFYVLTSLGPILTYSTYLGHGKYRTTRRYPSGSTLTSEVMVEKGGNLTIDPKNSIFIDRSGPFEETFRPTGVNKLEGRGRFSTFLPIGGGGGVVLIESFTVDQPRQGDVATNPRLRLAENQPQDGYRDWNPESIRRFIAPPELPSSENPPQVIHVELENSKGTDHGEGTYRKWLIMLDNGDVIRILVQQSHHGKGSYEVERAWVFSLKPWEAGKIPDLVESKTLNFSTVSERGNGTLDAGREPIYELSEQNEGEYPWKIRFQFEATRDGAGDNRIILSENVSVEALPVKSEESSALANFRRAFSSGASRGIVLYTDQESTRFASRFPKNQSAVLKLFGQIGGAVVLHDLPIEIGVNFDDQGKPTVQSQKLESLVQVAGELAVLQMDVEPDSEGRIRISIPYGTKSTETPKYLQASAIAHPRFPALIGVGGDKKIITRNLQQATDGWVLESNDSSFLFQTGNRLVRVNLPSEMDPSEVLYYLNSPQEEKAPAELSFTVVQEGDQSAEQNGRLVRKPNGWFLQLESERDQGTARALSFDMQAFSIAEQTTQIELPKPPPPRQGPLLQLGAAVVANVDDLKNFSDSVEVWVRMTAETPLEGNNFLRTYSFIVQSGEHEGDRLELTVVANEEVSRRQEGFSRTSILEVRKYTYFSRQNGTTTDLSENVGKAAAGQNKITLLPFPSGETLRVHSHLLALARTSTTTQQEVNQSRSQLLVLQKAPAVTAAASASSAAAGNPSAAVCDPAPGAQSVASVSDFVRVVRDLLVQRTQVSVPVDHRSSLLQAIRVREEEDMVGGELNESRYLSRVYRVFSGLVREGVLREDELNTHVLPLIHQLERGTVSSPAGTSRFAPFSSLTVCDPADPASAAEAEAEAPAGNLPRAAAMSGGVSSEAPRTVVQRVSEALAAELPPAAQAVADVAAEERTEGATDAAAAPSCSAELSRPLEVARELFVPSEATRTLMRLAAPGSEEMPADGTEAVFTYFGRALTGRKGIEDEGRYTLELQVPMIVRERKWLPRPTGEVVLREYEFERVGEKEKHAKKWGDRILRAEVRESYTGEGAAQKWELQFSAESALFNRGVSVEDRRLTVLRSVRGREGTTGFLSVDSALRVGGKSRNGGVIRRASEFFEAVNSPADPLFTARLPKETTSIDLLSEPINNLSRLLPTQGSVGRNFDLEPLPELPPLPDPSDAELYTHPVPLDSVSRGVTTLPLQYVSRGLEGFAQLRLQSTEEGSAISPIYNYSLRLSDEHFIRFQIERGDETSFPLAISATLYRQGAGVPGGNSSAEGVPLNFSYQDENGGRFVALHPETGMLVEIPLDSIREERVGEQRHLNPPVAPIIVKEVVPPEQVRDAQWLYETPEGKTAAAGQIAEFFRISPELIYWDAGMALSHESNVEGEYSSIYRRGPLQLKLNFEFRGHGDGRRAVVVDAEATYDGYAGKIPTKVIDLKGRQFIALGGRFEGIVFDRTSFGKVRERSRPEIRRAIVSWLGLTQIEDQKPYNPRVPYPEIKEGDPLDQALKSQLAANQRIAESIYETSAGIQEIKARIGTALGVSPELLHWPLDQSDPLGMELQYQGKDGMTYSYERGPLRMAVSYVVSDSTKPAGRGNPLILQKAVATYRGYTGEIPTRIYSYQGRHFVGLGGPFQGIAFQVYPRGRAVFKELSHHQVGQTIAQLLGLEELEYNPRAEYPPIEPETPQGEIFLGQMEENRALLPAKSYEAVAMSIFSNRSSEAVAKGTLQLVSAGAIDPTDFDRRIDTFELRFERGGRLRMNLSRLAVRSGRYVTRMATFHSSSTDLTGTAVKDLQIIQKGTGIGNVVVTLDNDQVITIPRTAIVEATGGDSRISMALRVDLALTDGMEEIPGIFERRNSRPAEIAEFFSKRVSALRRTAISLDVQIEGKTVKVDVEFLGTDRENSNRQYFSLSVTGKAPTYLKVDRLRKDYHPVGAIAEDRSLSVISFGKTGLNHHLLQLSDGSSVEIDPYLFRELSEGRSISSSYRLVTIHSFSESNGGMCVSEEVAGSPQFSSPFEEMRTSRELQSFVTEVGEVDLNSEKLGKDLYLRLEALVLDGYSQFVPLRDCLQLIVNGTRSNDQLRPYLNDLLLHATTSWLREVPRSPEQEIRLGNPERSATAFLDSYRQGREIEEKTFGDLRELVRLVHDRIEREKREEAERRKEEERR